MTLFRGRYDYTVDSKGRLNIPAKWRKQIAPDADETFVVSKAPGGCLRAYPQDEWAKHEERMDALPLSRENDRLQRAIQNTLTDSVLDKQGRVSLSAGQMEMSGITKNITLIGRRNHIEVWDTDRFETYLGDGDDFDDIYYAAVTKL